MKVIIAFDALNVFIILEHLYCIFGYFLILLRVQQLFFIPQHLIAFKPRLEYPSRKLLKKLETQKVKKKKRLVAFFSFLLAMVNLFSSSKKKARVTVRE